MKYIEIPTKIVEKRITKLVPDPFAIVFDGLSAGDTHCVTIISTFPANNRLGYNHVLLQLLRVLLLVISPLEHEKLQDADKQYEFLTSVLSIYCETI